MPCTVLPSPTSIPLGVQATGQTVKPRGLWNPRFLGLPSCENLPMVGNVEDRNWENIETNIVQGLPAIQNVMPPLAQNPYAGGPPAPLGNAGPAAQIVGVPVPTWWAPGMAPDAGLDLTLFVDECMMNNVYGVGHEWQVAGSVSSTACVYSFVSMAPQGTAAVAGRGGSQVLNTCPTFLVETSSMPQASFFEGWWGTCSFVQPTTPPTPYNLCPPSNPSTGYGQCNSGSIARIRANDLSVPNSFAWMRGLFFEFQVHHLIPSTLTNKYLLVASRIQPYQVI